MCTYGATTEQITSSIQELVSVDYPCQRWVSRGCAVTFVKTETGHGDSIGICQACANTNREGGSEFKFSYGFNVGKIWVSTFCLN